MGISCIAFILHVYIMFYGTLTLFERLQTHAQNRIKHEISLGRPSHGFIELIESTALSKALSSNLSYCIVNSDGVAKRQNLLKKIYKVVECSLKS